jgi:pimeloyl-ACP methyl ester carboxylesterase
MRLLASLGLCAAALAGCASYNPVNYLNPAGVPQVPPMTPRPFAVQEIGSFHVGGRQAVLSGLPEKDVKFTPTSPVTRLNPNGEFEVEQMYVQYVKLADSARSARYPLLMIHGGGLSGVTWETKPDGKSGWQQYFLRAGHDVYVADAVERGRASWARYPEIFTSEPVFRTKKEAWELFRIGPRYEVSPAVREAYPGTQFPLAVFDQFMKQGVPRWVTNDAPTLAAYDALVQKICPCVFMVHSQGSTFAYALANKYPDKVKAVVGIEPSGALDAEKVSIAGLKQVPLLFVWGDKIRETPRWVQIQGALKKMIAAQKAQGGQADEFDLPQMGITGNSHMIMMDRNSDQIARLVQQWMEKQGLVE